ncbi:MAG: hypothetical protein ABIH24_01335 [Verrucomicrobiota bacterium]
MGTMLFRYEGKIGSLWKAYLESPDVSLPERAWRIVLEPNNDFPTGRTVVMIPYWPAIEKGARLEQPWGLQSVLGGNPLPGVEMLIRQCLNSRGSDVKVRELCQYIRKVTGYKLKPKPCQDLAEMFKNDLMSMVRRHIIPHSEMAEWIGILAKMADTDIIPFVLAIMRDTIGKNIVSEWTECICKTESINKKDAESALVKNANYVAVVQCEPKNHLYPMREYSVIRPTAEDQRHTPVRNMLAGVIFSTSGFEVTVSGLRARLTERQFKLLMCIAKEIEAGYPSGKENVVKPSASPRRVVTFEFIKNDYIISIDLAYACLRVPLCRRYVNRNDQLKPQYQLSTIFKDAEGPKVMDLIFKTIGDRNHAHWVPRP